MHESDEDGRQDPAAGSTLGWTPGSTPDSTPGPTPGYWSAASQEPPRVSRWRRLDAVTATLAALVVILSAVAGGSLAAALHHDATASNDAGTAQRQLPIAPFNQFGPGGSNGGSNGGTNGGQAAPTQPIDPTTIGRKAAPGVVNIMTTIGYQQAEAAGTGMVLSADGEVLTNNHVIKGATRIRATVVGTGATYDARVVGYDPSHDVAVLQLVGASDLPTVTASSDAVHVGQQVVAVGNAGGRGGDPTYAGGVVTALGRSITASDQSDGTSEQLTGLIETNADVVPGDSGGPLVDESGAVVGMNTAASADFRFSAGGRGYAIPISDALSIARQITAGKSVGTVHVGPTAMLGVEVQSGGNNANSYYYGQTGGSGALVAGVVSGGPAADAGLVPGVVITEVDGHQVTSADDLTDVMLGEQPGSTVTVLYVDNQGQQQSTQVRLASGPPQ